MKNKSGFIIALLLIAGVVIMIYPYINDAIVCCRHSGEISSYTDNTASADRESMARMLKAAENYNLRLHEHGFGMEIRKDMSEEYERLLDPSGNGMMGYIKIPAINVELPLYHGMDETVLAAYAGHISGSSLPTGGIGCHTVIAGHSGLSSARLFTNLDELEIGDRFGVYILNRELVYEVDQINVVKPEDTELLEPVNGMDLCTLITCTPYGVNSHRLLVRGMRVYEEKAAGEMAVISWADLILISAAVAGIIAAVMAAAVLLIVLFEKPMIKKKGTT